MKAILFSLLFTGIFSVLLEGIDVSSYQGSINWAAVAKTKHFAILRAGTGFKGVDNKDSKFKDNYRDAKNAGVKVGAYYYSYAQSVEGAKNEANWFLNHLKGKKFEWQFIMILKKLPNLRLEFIMLLPKLFAAF